MIKESSNLTGQEPNMLPSLDKYLHGKNVRYELIPSRDIADQGILQSDWISDTNGNS